MRCSIKIRGTQFICKCFGNSHRGADGFGAVILMFGGAATNHVRPDDLYHSRGPGTEAGEKPKLVESDRDPRRGQPA